MRVTAGGLVPPRKVLVATWLAFAIAVAAGAYLIALVGWELLAIGAASILAGVLYTGGPRPYGYEGLGRAVRVRVLRRRGRDRVVLRADRGAELAGPRRCPSRSACWPPRSWSSTTSATSTPTGAPASARWPCGSAATGPGACSRSRVTLPFAIVVAIAAIEARPELLLALLAAPLVPAARAHGLLAHRRALAERGARTLRGAAGAVLRAALRGPPRCHDLGRRAHRGVRGGARSRCGSASRT